MKRSHETSTIATAAVLALLAAPALSAAQDNRRGGGQSRAEAGQERRGSPQAPQQAAPPPSGSPREQSAPRRAQPQFQQRFDQPRAPQPQPQPRVDQPRSDQRQFDQRRSDQRSFDQRRPDQRSFDQRRPDQRSFDQGRSTPRYDNRRFDAPRAIPAPRAFEQRRYDDRRFGPPRYIRPGIVVTRPYYSPFYTFRPRLSLGFGLWAGFPVFYSTYGANYAPYPYVYAPNYYAGSTAAVLAPGAVIPTGGLSFDITPVDAEVYIDGQYVGRVSDFSPTEQPLPLTPGRHRVEVVANGYRALSFDTDIITGQVIPYQGAMQPQ